MLLVKTEVKPSKIHGLGLFILEDVLAGDYIEIVDSLFYKILYEDEVARFKGDSIKEQFAKDYLFKYRGLYFASLDNGRFGNHSDNSNCFWNEANEFARTRGVFGYFFASREIKSGEELTFNYNEFCEKGCDF